jgi:MFS family permease
MSSIIKSTEEQQITKIEEEKQVETINRAKKLTIMSLMVAIMFLVSLDRTIIGVAIPTITDEFGSIPDIGWYGSAYMLANASLQLLFGRIYKIAPMKITFVTSIVIFEIGSAVCGAAPTSAALIIGRAIAGAGAAGIFSGAIQIMLEIIPLQDRPMWQALFAAVMGVSSALGPLIGGSFTTKVSWRWCFYINLPLGAVVIVVILYLLQINNKRSNTEVKTIRQIIVFLDPIGFVMLLSCITCLLLALQYGGTKYLWSNGRMIALLVLFSILLIAFIASQYIQQEKALLPPRVFLQRSVQGAFWYMFFFTGSMTIMIYYIPIWFQIVKGDTALNSSYKTLASILPLVVSAMVSGGCAKKFGYYAPQMMIAPMLASIGVGLMTTWTVNTSKSKWTGYQVLYGLGLGFGIQGSSMSVQASLVKADISIGMASVFFSQQMGGAIWISVANNILVDTVIKSLSHIQGINAKALANMGATQVRGAVDPNQLPLVLNAYNSGLRNVWITALALICVTIIPFTLIEWRNIKKSQPGSEHEKKSIEQVEKKEARIEIESTDASSKA